MTRKQIKASSHGRLGAGALMSWIVFDTAKTKVATFEDVYDLIIYARTGNYAMRADACGLLELASVNDGIEELIWLRDNSCAAVSAAERELGELVTSPIYNGTRPVDGPEIVLEEALKGWGCKIINREGIPLSKVINRHVGNHIPWCSCTLVFSGEAEKTGETEHIRSLLFAQAELKASGTGLHSRVAAKEL